MTRLEHGFGGTRGVQGTGSAGPGLVSQVHTVRKPCTPPQFVVCEAHWAVTTVRSHSFCVVTRADNQNRDRDCNHHHHHHHDNDAACSDGR